MTIKDVEIRAGMTRANIRFYESEGLLSPKRNENGYRDYSEKDIEILLRIKLLRTLHISLEEIKSIHNSERELEEVLKNHIKTLNVEKKHIEESQNLCQIMCNDHVRYENLNAQRYLDTMNKKEEQPSYDSEKDVLPRVGEPWRRFWARSLDLMIYSTIGNLFLLVVFRVNIDGLGFAGTLLSAFFSLFLTILVEPILLSTVGTTLGKAIFGLYVTNLEDGKLSHQEAFSRTGRVLWKGMGLQIPGYEIWRLWKSYSTVSEGYTALDWEDESILAIKDRKIWRIFACVGAYLMLFGALFIGVLVAEMPKNRGDITVAEFCQNYNQFANYFDIEGQLESTGEWKEYENVIVVMHGSEKPDFVFTEKDGKMKGLSFTVETKNEDSFLVGYSNEMAIAALAFMKAQNSCSIFDTRMNEIIQEMVENPFYDFEFEEYGVTLRCDVEYSGYLHSEGAGMLIPEDGEEQSFYISFTMEKK